MDIDVKWMFSSIVKFNASRIVTSFTNPVSHTVSLSLSAAPPKNSRLVLYDLTGRMVKNIAATTQQVTMQVSDLPDGSYILQLRSGDHVEQFRLIKQ